MTKFIYILLIIMVLSKCASVIKLHDTQICFEKDEYNFGELNVTDTVYHPFVFFNRGEYPLVILDVRTSCGCTVPTWFSKPIKPREKSEIKIKYTPTAIGMFSKKIQIYYNGEDSPVDLIIKGKVKNPYK